MTQLGKIFILQPPARAGQHGAPAALGKGKGYYANCCKLCIGGGGHLLYCLQRL